MARKVQPFGTDLVTPDLLKLAEAFRIKGFQLTDLTNEEGLRNISQSPPALIEVPVVPAVLPIL